MTIYEFMLDCKKHNVRLEVDVGGLIGAALLFRRLDEYAESGAGRIVSSLPGHSTVADLTLDDARYLLEGIDRVHVGVPGQPARGPERPTAAALAALPADATFEASYFEI